VAKHVRNRVVVERVRPEIDAGRFPIKRVAGESVVVEADAFADGHDAITCVLRYRPAGGEWREAPMEALGNDRWRGEFVVEKLGPHEYTVAAWLDVFASWQRDLRKKVDAGQNVSVELLGGAELVTKAARRAKGDKRLLKEWAERLEATEPDPAAGLAPELAELMARHAERRDVTTYERVLDVRVGPTDAAFSSWYEFFPRSFGTLADAERMLPYIERMGFSVVYLPPVHPIGVTNRKGRNNTTESDADDPGSPWAIGSEDGGHTSINPDLGTFDEFDRFVARAREHGLEVAMDLAFQCSPDHPYVKERPEWFRRRADGTIQYAENPPKRYEDIYPLDFECEAREELWAELRNVVDFWVDRGVRVFRVDNPHTKPFAFWEWLIGGVHEDRPDVVFLSEAFTRPKVMNRLAKVGFDQSYTYFTWRTTKWELTEYLTELTQTETADFFRPNLWPNTPDILPEHLHHQGAPAFMARLVLAATLGANYGIYGPAYELCENIPLAPGREEYLNSEKFEIKKWDVDDPHSLSDLIARVNRIRADNESLHSDRTLRFREIQNDNLIAYTKQSPDGSNLVLVVVNLDAEHIQSGMLHLPLGELGIDEHASYGVHDLLTEARYLWHGEWNYIELDPGSIPAHIFRLRTRLSREEDFDYFS
jgi:starch synthase (maltosyl-transferring)